MNPGSDHRENRNAKAHLGEGQLIVQVVEYELAQLGNDFRVRFRYKLLPLLDLQQQCSQKQGYTTNRASMLSADQLLQGCFQEASRVMSLQWLAHGAESMDFWHAFALLG